MHSLPKHCSFLRDKMQDAYHKRQSAPDEARYYTIVHVLSSCRKMLATGDVTAHSFITVQILRDILKKQADDNARQMM